MPRYAIRHSTTYRYRSPVAFGEHRVMFRPRPAPDQTVLRAALDVLPAPVSATWTENAGGNLVDVVRFGLERRARELVFTARIAVETEPTRPVEPRLAEHARRAPFSYGAEEMSDLSRFRERRQPDPDHSVDHWARTLLDHDPERGTFAFLCRLNAAIRRDFAYLRRDEKGVQDAAVTLRTRRGSCRDFAILMAEAVRSQGFAARFVSGYLRVRDGDPVSRLAGGSTHAWLQVFLPGAGWVDFDPTSGTVGNEDLVRVAIVADPAAAVPLSGSFIGFPRDFLEMVVSVDVALAASPSDVDRRIEPTAA